MRLTGVIFLSAIGVFVLASVADAADAANVDYTERNSAFAPVASVTPATSQPQVNDGLQNQRVTPAVVDKKDAAVGDRRAAIDLTEARAKTVIEKDSHRPEAVTRQLSAFDHRDSGINPSAQVEKPPTVTRYQSSLTAASVTNMSRFPALNQATAARVNRFIFRRNEPSAPVPAASVVPAASGPRP